MRKKRRTWAGGLLALCMAIGLFGGGPVRAETAEYEWFETVPSSKCYDSLWVGDVVTFSTDGSMAGSETGYDYYVDDPGEDGDRDWHGFCTVRLTTWSPDSFSFPVTERQMSATVLSGEGVTPTFVDMGDGGDRCGIRFTKPGKSTVKVTVIDPDTGNREERVLSFTVSQRPADKPVTAEKVSIKTTYKIGEQSNGKEGSSWKYLVVQNLNYSTDIKIENDFGLRLLVRGNESLFDVYDGNGGKGGYYPTLIKENRSHSYTVGVWGVAARPGTRTWRLDYNGKPVGEVTAVTVEEPVITTNAPASIKAGSTLSLTTALTNTVLKNRKVAEYDKFVNWPEDNWDFPYEELNKLNPVAYQPSVTVLEGKDCVAQSSRDYSHTLTTSETLTFIKAGAVKLKVTYTQLKTDPLGYHELYHPEKILTIQVTKDGQPAQPPKGTTTPAGNTGTTPAPGSSSVPAGSAPGSTPSGESTSSSNEPTLPPVILTDESTGIQLGAAEGVVPPDTALVVKPSNFVLEDAAGKFTAFDISLESGGAKIQPNGRVQVSIPVPAGYDKERLTVYHIADDGTKTELPCTVSGEAIIFETDHFSLYVLAEKAAAQAADGAPQPEKPGGSPVGWIVLAAVLLAAAGGGFALWWFKFRKKPDAAA